MSEQLPTEYSFPLIVLDLEWNQRYGRQQGSTNMLPQEIVEIGAVKLNAQGRILEQFRRTVRPVVHPVLHRHVQRVTGISAEDCRDGGTFVQACADLMAFCGTTFTLCTWGPDDYPVLQRNLAYWMQPQDWVRYPIDAQRVYAMLCGEAGKAKQTSLQTAMEALGVAQELPHHRALHDAYHTALICQRLLEQIRTLPENDPRAAMLRAARAVHLPRYLARCDTRVTEHRTPEALMADEGALAIRCPQCGCALACPPSRRLYSPSRQLLEQFSSCPDHGQVSARYALQRTAEGALTVRVQTELATEKQAVQFAERCASQNVPRRNRRRGGSRNRPRAARSAEQPT